MDEQEEVVLTVISLVAVILSACWLGAGGPPTVPGCVIVLSMAQFIFSASKHYLLLSTLMLSPVLWSREVTEP